MSIPFTAILHKEFKNIPKWRRNITSVKLIKFMVAHYQKTFLTCVKIDPTLNSYLMAKGKSINKIKLLLDISTDNDIKLINIKIDSTNLTWSEKKLLK